MLKRSHMIAAAFVGLILLSFQNCGGMMPGKGFKAQTSKGGEGYDGKPTFINFGECNGLVAPKNKIEFAKDMKSAEITRASCQDLNTPTKVNLDDITVSMQDNGAFVFGGEIFDLQRKSLTERKVTKRLCWSNSGGELREAAVWFLGDAVALNTGFVPVLKGYARRQAGAAWTGKLGPISETQSGATSFTYNVTPNEAGDTMTLIVDHSISPITNSVNGSLSYTMSDENNGEVQTNLPVKCYTQLPPDT